MSFARERCVAEMRYLLLQYGANESDEERKRLDLHQRADVAEKIMKIMKDYNPWPGKEMDF